MTDTDTSAETKFSQLFDELYKLCDENNWGDPFSYARAREINLANLLGHKISSTLSGADGYQEVDGKLVPVEYKSTISKKIKADYNGISVQDTWENMGEYIRNEKIGKYPFHYYSRYEGSKIVEVYRLTGEQVINIGLPKLKKQFENTKKKKDPRASFAITTKEIKEFGIQISLE